MARARENKSLWEKIRDWIADIIGQIRRSWQELNQASKTAQVLKGTVESLDEIERLFTEGVREAGERTRTAEMVTGMNERNMQVSRRYSVEYENAEPNQSIIDMVKKVKTGIFNDNDPVELGYISDKNAEIIQKLTGINVNGYKMVIEARQIRHILRDHGENGLANQSMADPNDIAKMEYALENPDTIVNAGKTKAYSYMKNGYNRTADTVRYEKNIGEDNYYVIQAVPEAKAKTLFVVGAYIGNQEHNKKAPQPASAHGTNRAPNATSENAATDAFGNRIPQESDSVNSKFSISEENSSDIRYSIDETPETPDVSEIEDDTNDGGTEEKLTDRELLLAVAEQMVGSEAEYKIVSDYKAQMDEQTARQSRVEKLTDEMREQQSVLFSASSTAEERSAASKRLKDIYTELAALSEEMAKVDRKLAEIEGITDDDSPQ